MFLGCFKQSDNYDRVTKTIHSYIQKSMNHGKDIGKALMTGKDIDFDDIINQLATLTANVSKIQKIAASWRVQQVIDTKELYSTNKV